MWTRFIFLCLGGYPMVWFFFIFFVFKFQITQEKYVIFILVMLWVWILIVCNWIFFKQQKWDLIDGINLHFVLALKKLFQGVTIKLGLFHEQFFNGCPLGNWTQSMPKLGVWNSFVRTCYGWSSYVLWSLWSCIKNHWQQKEKKHKRSGFISFE